MKIKKGDFLTYSICDKQYLQFQRVLSHMKYIIHQI